MGIIVESKIKLEDLGYNDYFESNRKGLGLDIFSIARVSSEYSGFYKVLNENGEYLARITGKQRQRATSRRDFPAVGDWVALSDLDADQATIQAFLPRTSIIERKRSDRDRQGEKNTLQIIATNIDIALIVEAVDRDYNLNRFERYLSIVRDNNIKPVIILNKVDLISKTELDLILTQVKDRLGEVDIITTSTVSEDGLDQLINYIEKGKTFCFLGSSGVGKSSVINRLLGSSIQKTGNISDHSGRGRHVTTNRQLYVLKSGGIVIDNPGMREVGITDITAGIESSFDLVYILSQGCKFKDCAHINEPGCNVLLAIKRGELDKEQYSNYINLKKEAEYYEINEVEKREKDRQFGKFVKKAKKEIKTSR